MRSALYTLRKLAEILTVQLLALLFTAGVLCLAALIACSKGKIKGKGSAWQATSECEPGLGSKPHCLVNVKLFAG